MSVVGFIIETSKEMENKMENKLSMTKTELYEFTDNAKLIATAEISAKLWGLLTWVDNLEMRKGIHLAIKEIENEPIE